MVLELVPAVTRQFDMLLPRNEEKQESVMAALDRVNRKYRRQHPVLGELLF